MKSSMVELKGTENKISVLLFANDITDHFDYDQLNCWLVEDMMN